MQAFKVGRIKKGNSDQDPLQKNSETVIPLIYRTKTQASLYCPL